MTQIKPDTLWIIQPENRRYVSGFKAMDVQLNESSGSLIIQQRRAWLLTDSRYTIEAQKQAKAFQVKTLKKGLAKELPHVLSRVKTQILGFEGGSLSWDLHRKITKRLRALSPPIKSAAIDNLVDDMRVIKDRKEIKTMEASATMMAKILDAVISGLKPGRTEKEVAWEIECLAREAGADDLAFPSIVASGPNSALPHAVPTNRKIRPHEPIIFDVGIRLDGYCCDMTRTVFLGTPNRMFQKIYRVVRNAQLMALRAAQPGIGSAQLDGIARDIITDAGFGDYFGHALGHGVGLATHEDPRIGPKSSVTLEQGMVFTIEPGIYIPGKGGVRLEEMVVVGRQGVRVLTPADHVYDFG
jgi:Xaa-Pro aminopeptidase